MRKIVVPISGGKDSQACLKLALQEYRPEEVLGLFCDTQFEHPKTYLHIEHLKELYGVTIQRVCAGSVVDKVRKHRRFPEPNIRFCTDELKIRISRDFYKYFAALNGPFEVWFGMRTEESSQRAKRYAGKVADEVYAPHEFMPSKFPKYLQKMGVMFRLPIVNWHRDDVLEYLEGMHNPLYDEGFDRVGCFPCLASGDKWKEKAFVHDEFGKSQRVIVIQLEKELGKSIWTSKTCQLKYDADGPGCLMCSI
jgi:3'-phosphoadenosine 5'-phosphosulfate sulfotransferase (PAPS reductase)/FAD synthetase